jgi:hypothetical protein
MVTMNSGEKFALDLAGAQYGHHDPVLPWNEYEEERILHEKDVEEVICPFWVGDIGC